MRCRVVIEVDFRHHLLSVRGGAELLALYDLDEAVAMAFVSCRSHFGENATVVGYRQAGTRSVTRRRKSEIFLYTVSIENYLLTFLLSSRKLPRNCSVSAIKVIVSPRINRLTEGEQPHSHAVRFWSPVSGVSRERGGIGHSCDAHRYDLIGDR